MKMALPQSGSRHHSSKLPRSSPLETDPSSTATVYVVDDDEAGRESLIASLVAQHYKVVGYESADAFLREADLEALGCVISDFRMPGMNGTELQAELNARRALLPLIMVSGFADVPIAVRAMQQGAVTLLEKPYQNSELLAAIEESLRRSRVAREEREIKEVVKNGLEELTPIQLQVMKLLVNGKANKAVASQLELGLRTVERHRQHILRVMNVESLPELATLLTRAGEACESTEDR